MNLTDITLTIRSLHVRRAAAAVALCAISTLADAFTLADVPQFLPAPLPPNIVVSLDDSGSMRWAYAPDALCGTHNTRRAKSSDFNPIYYNPRVTYPAPLNADGTERSTSFTAAWRNGFHTAHGSHNLSADYWVTWAYDPDTTGVSTNFNLCGGSATNNNYAEHPAVDYNPMGGPDLRRSGVPAYYYLYDPMGTGCAAPANTNDACYRRVLVSATSGTFDRNGNGVIDADEIDERQNFANWYSFYRTRNLLTASAATRAFATLPTDARVAWQALNSCNRSFTDASGFNCRGWGVSSPGVNNRMSRLDRIVSGSTTHRQNLYSWLHRLPADGGTPLRGAVQRAGDYYRSSVAANGTNTPYALDPQVTAGTEYACRPNFHILMTDGVWNESNASFCAGATCGNVDNTARTLPDNTAYTARAPYRDTNSNSLSDVSFFYWATDLRPDLANLVIPYFVDRSGNEAAKYWNAKNDPATWQHMVNFTVGLGLRSTLSVTTPVDISWGGSTHGGNGYTNLASGAGSWPATASNSSPGNVYDLWHAAINSRGLAFNAENPAELGDALRQALNRIMEREAAASALSTNSTRISNDTLLFQARFSSVDWTGRLTALRVNDDGSVGTALWEATDAGKIPAPTARNIFSWSGSVGIAFTQAALTSAGMWSHINDADLLAYLRGDSSREQRNGGSWRDRSTPLGDIVNSDPVYVGTQNYAYNSLPEGSPYGSTPYNSFVAAKNSKRKMLYVGANDGMLHAFDAQTGEERFAFVPNAVVPNLALLAQPTYSHRYSVDGSPMAMDAFFGGSWRTVLVGSSGAGARSIFALDITDPDAFDATKVLWEINHGTAQRPVDAADPDYDDDLGHVLGQAVVVKANNGEWVAIFGNGYSSQDRRAVLYIVRLSDGALIRKIDTGIGDSGTPNGLGTPSLYDSNGDDVYDIAYAGDARGNVWKFDLSDANPSNWVIAFSATVGFPNGSPLFRARNASNQAQSITVPIRLVRAPSGYSGVILLFGTGRFFAIGDNISTQTQTFYGIWDNGTRITQTDRSPLQAQTISAIIEGGEEMWRDVSTNAVNYATQRGWYLDLPTSGERVIGRALVRGGRVIFTTVIPSADPCAFGGTGWLMELDAQTGKQLPYSVFDTNRDGMVNDSDQMRGGIRQLGGFGKTPVYLQNSTGGADSKLTGLTSGAINRVINRTISKALGRDSWLEMIQ